MGFTVREGGLKFGLVTKQTSYCKSTILPYKKERKDLCGNRQTCLFLWSGHLFCVLLWDGHSGAATEEAEERASDCEHRRSVRPEYSETLRLKERGVKRERRSGRRLCLPHPRYLWSAFRMMLSHSKMLKPTYLRLHFQVTTAFKWRLNAK